MSPASGPAFIFAATLPRVTRSVGSWARPLSPGQKQMVRSRRQSAERAGIGPLTASELAASAGDPSNFKNARQFAAWIGLVPHQNSSGGKTQLLGISKRGNVYLRTLLIHGGRTLGQLARTRPDRAQTWLGRLVGRRHHNVAAVAMANKNARLAWALLSSRKAYEPQHIAAAMA